MKKSLLVLGILLILAGPLILISGTVYTLMLPNIYQSAARISVSEDVPEIDPFSSQQDYSQSYNPYFLRTQFEIIQSKPVLYEVINRLNLQVEWGREGEKLPRAVALKILQNSVSIFQQRDTSLLCISVKRDNPNEAARIANEIAEVYRDARLDRAHKEARASIDKIQEVLKAQEQRVREAEQRIEQLRKSLDVTGEGPIDTNIRLQRLEEERLAAQQMMVTKGVQLRIIKEWEEKALIDRATHITFDPVVVNEVRQLQDIEIQLDLMEKDFGQNHPEVQQYHLQKKTLEKALEQRLVALKNGLETEYKIAETKLENAEKVLSELREQVINSNGEKYKPFRIAQSELESERFIYNQLQAKLRQKIITLEVPRNPVEIIDVAEPNVRPVSPNLYMNILLSLAVGAVPFITGIILIAVDASSKRPRSIS